MDDSTHASQDRLGVLIGTLALQKGLITPGQLREALAAQALEAAATKEDPAPLELVLVAKGFLTVDQLESLMEEERAQETKHEEGATAPAPAVPAGPPFGKYRLVRELGRGGMGVVYEALDTALNRTVALKLMLTSPHADAKETSMEEERFLREAKLAATLKHRGIVGVYEAGVIARRRYIAMEYVDGRQMNVWRKGGSITARLQVRMLRDVALAVAHAHDAGVMHRDLKPQNIMVDGKGHPHVADFGLARPVRHKASISLTASGMIVGTPAYMSPEQAQGKKSIDRRTDVWSLGVMLYEILTGRPPFRGETAIEILMKVIKEEVALPSSLVRVGSQSPVDKTIENICMKALAKEPRERYATAQTLADDLSRWLKGEEVRVEAPRRAARVPWGWIGASAAALVFLAVLLWPLPTPAADPWKNQLDRAERLEKQGNLEGALALFDLVLDGKRDHARARGGRERVLKLKAAPAKVEVSTKAPPEPPKPVEPARAAAPVPPPPPAGRVHVVLGDPVRSEGITPKAHANFPWQALKDYNGKPCFKLIRGKEGARLNLDVDDAFARRTIMAELEVEYFDAPAGGSFGIMYDAMLAREWSEFIWQEKINLAGSKSWRTARIALPFPRFENRQYGVADFCIASDNAELFVHRCVVAPISPASLRTPPLSEFPALGSAPAGPAPGLLGEYFEGMNFEKSLRKQVDPRVLFDWGEGGLPGGPSKQFSIRWTGFLRASAKGLYAFDLLVDDGARLTVDGAAVLTAWDYGPQTRMALLDLDAGYHKIVLEYFQDGKEASIMFECLTERDGRMRPLGPDCFFHEPPKAEPVSAEPPPKPVSVSGALVANKAKLAGQAVRLIKPPAADAAYIVKDITDTGLTLTMKIGPGATDITERIENLATVALLQLLDRAEPQPLPELVAATAKLLAGRGDYDEALRRLGRVKDPGAEIKEAVRTLLQEELSKATALNAPRDRLARLKRFRDARAPLFAAEMKAEVEAEIFSLDQTAKLSLPLPPGMRYVGKSRQETSEYLNLKDGAIMIMIPAGEFLMGRDVNDQPEIRPAHKVHTDAYFIDKTETTCLRWRRYCKETGLKSDPQGQDDHPASRIAWAEARAYCEWAGKRLPTEAEWEKAARGADGRLYPWGNEQPDQDGKFRANYGPGITPESFAKDGYAGVAPVGSYAAWPSPYGLLDMAGNLQEWCSDWFDPTYYAKVEYRNPQGPPTGQMRSARDGSYTNTNVSSTRRMGKDPAAKEGLLGFRGVRPAK